MKKFISVSVIAIMLFCSIAFFVSAEEVTSTGSGFSNVSFSNGYYGFCIDADFSGAYSGDNFVLARDTSAATNNDDNSDVSQQLKILFTQCFEDLFVSDGNGGYVIDSLKADSSIQNAVWHFTDGQYIWGESKSFVDKVKAYSGPAIPDNGYTRQLDNGDKITFYFTVATPLKGQQQSFFAYKIEVENVSASGHIHEYGDEWTHNDVDHWHECDCGEKAEELPHNGGTATCIESATCEDCNQPYGKRNPQNHTGGTEIRNRIEPEEFKDGYTGDTYCKGCDTLLEKGEVIKATHKHNFSEEWESDGTNHWHECDCKERTDETPHNGGTATCVKPSICDDCDQPYGEKNPENHTGGTELRNYVEPEEFKDGYTGDTYCKGCDTLLKEGEVIKATHVHRFGEEWKYDDDGHWHECTCDNKTEELPHSGGTPTCIKPSICEDCDQPYGEKNPENHTGGTELRNYVEPEEFKDGYTGDTYCKGCDTLLEEGEVIKATHVHSFGEEWKYDDDGHWHECTCEEQTEELPHNGGTPTCIEPSICDDCDQPYGEKNPENHTGGTEIRNYVEPDETKDGYTGDTYCKGCDTLLEEGEVISALHVHLFSEEWAYDDVDHWHECPCNKRTEELPHDGGRATCIDPADCEECNQPYGEKDPEKHDGGIELRNRVEPAEDKDGYTGDLYCKGCDILIKKGKIIKFLQEEIFDLGIKLNFNIQLHWPEKEEVITEEAITEEAITEETITEETNPVGESSTEPSTEAPKTNNNLLVPFTGDNSNVLLWCVILLISVVGVFFARKKTRKESF